MEKKTARISFRTSRELYDRVKEVADVTRITWSWIARDFVGVGLRCHTPNQLADISVLHREPREVLVGVRVTAEVEAALNEAAVAAQCTLSVILNGCLASVVLDA